MNLRAELQGECYVAKTREKRLVGRKLIIILEQACIELVHVGRGRHELLDGTRHKKLLEKNNDTRNPEDLRPDIAYGCIQALLDSALNRCGLLLIYIRTAGRQLIEVNPQWQAPATFIEFQSVMATLLLRKIVRAKEANLTLLRIIKNDLATVLPPGCRRIGLEMKGRMSSLEDFVKQFALAPENADTSSEAWKRKLISDFAYAKHNAEGEAVPIAFFIGAVAKGSPAAKEVNEWIEETIQISHFPLSAAICCAKTCHAFEELWCC